MVQAAQETRRKGSNYIFILEEMVRGIKVRCRYLTIEGLERKTTFPPLKESCEPEASHAFIVLLMTLPESGTLNFSSSCAVT